MSSETQVPGPADPSQGFHFKYTVQKGWFAQSEDSTNDREFDFRKSNFGFLGDTWALFERHVQRKQEEAQEGESYKVLFLGRHGQGWHNVAETKYGTKAWDCYYSALNGSDNITWSDANLTSTGQQQARDVNALWKQQLPLGIPAPQTYYVSPLTRTIETADISFADLDLPKERPYKPLIKELVREALGVHTCDRRSTKSHIEQTFPHVTFEHGFAESDMLWEKDYREPQSARRYRLAMFLDDVFANDGNVWVSMTSHSGAIASILEVVGHRKFALETGGVIPVFVKAVRRDGSREVPEREPSDAPPMCKEPPAGR